MGFFAAFKGNKAWTGVISDKKISTTSDSEGDGATKHCIVVELDGNTPRQRTLFVDAKLYDQAKVGNKVVKTADKKQPVIQLGS